MRGWGTKSTGRQRLSRSVKETENARLNSRGYCREERSWKRANEQRLGKGFLEHLSFALVVIEAATGTVG